MNNRIIQVQKMQNKKKLIQQVEETGNSETVHFGFQKVSSDTKKSLVNNIFSDVADHYDLMNDVMSLGIHRLWKNKFCAMIDNFKGKIIDVASGTGDIIFRIKERADMYHEDPYIVGCDINPEMLKICQDRAVDRNILTNLNLVNADAEKLPFPDATFDYYTIAFGIRNMVSVERVLQEAYRVLKKGGQFLCLEFSLLQNPIAKSLYEWYSFGIIPQIGKIIAGNKDAYRYLVESINLFLDQETFKIMIEQTGFSGVNYTNLTFGVVSIHSGYKI